MTNNLFKGLALFTPGGDVVYCLGNDKQEFWHIHLCMELKLILNLSEAPHFLIPGYSATVDRYFDQKTNNINTVAECYPAVSSYQLLLNVIFDLGDLRWQVAPWQEQFSSPIIFESYRHQFPELWESHNLIVRCYPRKMMMETKNDLLDGNDKNFAGNFYLFYLFISKKNQDNEIILQNVYNFLANRSKKNYSLKIIVIEDNTELVENYHISATPTLIRIFPEPLKRMVGNLKDVGKIIGFLDN